METTSTYSVDEDDVQDRQEVDVPAAKDALPSRPTQLGARRAAHIIHALLRQLDLIMAKVESPRIFRQVRDQEDASDGNRHANHTVHDKQPLPTGQAVQAIHAIVHTCLEVPAKHRRGGGRSVEDTSTLCQLRRLVPRP